MSNRKPDIIEKDLFNYIFHPEYLDTNKYNFIETNQLIFLEEIQFLLKLKNQLKIKVSNKIIEKILSKIHKLNCKSIVQLNKVDYPTNISNNLILAADSPNDYEKPISETYQDEDSNFLVKLISNNKQKKIYAFCKNGISMNNIRLVIHPSEKTFRLKDSSEQIILNSDEVVESISIITS